MSVGINVLSLSASSLISRVVGDSEKQLAHIFTRAHDMAPVMIVLDQIEMIAPARDHHDSMQHHDRLLSALLTHLDGIHT